MVQDEPLISVITSIYNGEKYLKECLDSVLNQDYTNIEFIIVDDGSFDNSGYIIDEYAQKDPRIKVFHKENSGVSNSRNLALEKASGEYICLIDQDDVFATNYISYFYNLIKTYQSEIAITLSPKKFFGDIPTSDTQKDKVLVQTGEQTAIMMLYHKMVIAPWNKMISNVVLNVFR